MRDNLPPLPEAANDNMKHGRAGYSRPSGPVFTADQMHAYARAAIEADLVIRDVPAGWKLVPVKPTPEMNDAANYAYDQWGWNSASKMYAAMLAAAPQPQPVAQPVQEGPMAATVEESARDVGKWLNERPNRPLDLRHVAMLVHHAQKAFVCQTCGGHGMIGGPSFYAPDEGGVPCPGCSQPDGMQPLDVLTSIWNAMQNSADGDDLLNKLEHMRDSIERAVQGAQQQALQELADDAQKVYDGYTAQPVQAQPSEAVADVLAERQRQISVEGWTPEHDDEHTDDELSLAAASYAICDRAHMSPPGFWPWDRKWWKPSDQPRRNLIKAGALILAEIERLDRAHGITPATVEKEGE